MKFDLSKYDARVKLLLSLCLIVVCISSQSIIIPFFIISCSLIVVLSAGIRLWSFLGKLIEPLMIASVIVVLKTFFFYGKSSDMLLIFGYSLKYSSQGLTEGIMIAFRVMSATAVMALYILGTSFSEIIKALSWLRCPKSLVEILIFAYHYLHTFKEDAKVIFIAQKNRLGYSTPTKSLASIGTLSGALVLKAFDSSQTLSLAMSQRGFDGSIAVLRQKSLSKTQIFSVIFIVALLVSINVLLH